DPSYEAPKQPVAVLPLHGGSQRFGMRLGGNHPTERFASGWFMTDEYESDRAQDMGSERLAGPARSGQAAHDDTPKVEISKQLFGNRLTFGYFERPDETGDASFGVSITLGGEKKLKATGGRKEQLPVPPGVFEQERRAVEKALSAPENAEKLTVLRAFFEEYIGAKKTGHTDIESAALALKHYRVNPSLIASIAQQLNVNSTYLPQVVGNVFHEDSMAGLKVAADFIEQKAQSRRQTQQLKQAVYPSKESFGRMLYQLLLEGKDAELSQLRDLIYAGRDGKQKNSLDQVAAMHGIERAVLLENLHALAAALNPKVRPPREEQAIVFYLADLFQVAPTYKGESPAVGGRHL
ncbi:MAG TPA: hypothetical protein PLQ67_10690, partial [Burkholderiaceae bacterium]|nr:hypothetical protein [Burkholderiaceae bacterium]